MKKKKLLFLKNYYLFLGVSFNLWQKESTTLPLLLAFCQQTPSTPLIASVCELAPRLVCHLFETTLAGETSTHSTLLPMLCDRFQFIAPLSDYQTSMRNVLCSLVEKLFQS